MEAAPPRGSTHMTLHVRSSRSRERSIRLILDPKGNLLSFSDGLAYDSLGTSVDRSINVGFAADGSVRSGMAHHHESTGETGPTTADSELSSEYYAAIVQAVRDLRKRCGA